MRVFNIDLQVVPKELSEGLAEVIKKYPARFESSSNSVSLKFCKSDEGKGIAVTSSDEIFWLIFRDKRSF